MILIVMGEIGTLLCSKVLNKDIKEIIYNKLCTLKQIPKSLSEDIKSARYIHDLKSIYIEKFGNSTRTLDILLVDLHIIGLVLAVTHKEDYSELLKYEPLNNAAMHCKDEMNCIVNQFWFNRYTDVKRKEFKHLVDESQKSGNILNLRLGECDWIR